MPADAPSAAMARALDVPARPEPAPSLSPDARPARRWLVGSAVIGASGPLVGLVLAMQGPLVLAGVLHAVAAAAAWQLWRRPGEGGAALATVATTLCACFPVVGSVGAWWVYGRPVDPKSALVDAYKAYIGKNWEVVNDLAPLADPEAALGRELSVLPLGDQLTGADLAGKQGAASALMRLEGGAGVRILREALVHPASDTRLMASLALLKKEEALVSELKGAREHAASRPDAEAFLALAGVASRYAESGLCAPRAAEALWREAASEAERGAPADPIAAWTMVATARLALCEPQKALEAADRILGVAKSVANAEATGQRLRLEALFGLGRFDALAVGAARLQAIAEPGSEAHEIASFWSAHVR